MSFRGPQRSHALHTALVMALGLSVPPLTATAAADVTIAVAGPFEAREADRFAAIRQAVETAVEALNTKGGILGQPVRVIAVDDACDGATAETVARDLTANRIALVIGHPCTRAALAAADVYADSSTVFMATTTRHPRLTRKRETGLVLRLAGRDDRQGDAAARYISDASPPGAIAVVHDRTAYATGLAEAVTAGLRQAGRNDIIAATISAGDMEYRKLTDKIKGAAAVYFAGFPLEAGFIVESLRAAGSGALFVGSDSLATGEFVATYGASIKGVKVAVSSASNLGALEQRGDAAAASKAVSLYAEAANRVGRLDRDAIIATLTAGSPDDNPAAPFTAAGDAVTESFRIVEWDGVAWVKVRD
jgi:branched-chain amino acid transport system substrate-binding protein